MALISAKTILTSLSLFHVTLGFFFLTSPVTVADQALVFILGESMGMVGFFSLSFFLLRSLGGKGAGFRQSPGPRKMGLSWCVSRRFPTD